MARGLECPDPAVWCPHGVPVIARHIAALYVDPRGCYSGLAGVDLWDETRDARTYPGPHPVVAHPPCSRWCRLAGLVEARWGHKRGDDGGCFASALAAVRQWGGVLEHPAYTHAWAAHGLADPPAEGWQRTIDGAWVCQVEQGHYGHPARKATWLYAVGVVLPELRWGPSTARDAYITGARLPAMVSWCSNHTKGPPRPRLRKRAASATPPAFRDVLLAISRRA